MLQSLDLRHDDAKGFCVYARHEGDIYTEDVFPQPYRYMPLTLYFFKLYCLVPFQFVIAFFFSLIVLGVMLCQTHVKGRFWYLVVLLLLGFNSFYYNLSTGNPGIIEAVFLVLIIYFVGRKSYLIASIIAGIMPVFKVFPIFYVFAFLCIQEIDVRARVRMMLQSFLVLACLHLISYLLNPMLYESWLLNIFSYPVIDNAGWINPSLLGLLGNFDVYFIVVVCALFGLIMFDTYAYQIPFVWMLLIIMLLLPEFKMYTYTSAVVIVYLLSWDFNDFVKFLIICSSCVLPIVYKSLGFTTSYVYAFLMFTVVVILFHLRFSLNKYIKDENV